MWAARRWGLSAEQIELYYGERWKQWQPLNEIERSDILRAATGYALGEDALGLSRFREKYAAKMAQTPDARDFEIVSAPLGTSGAEFRNIAHAAASVDTLEGFLRDVQARYPDASALPPRRRQYLPRHVFCAAQDAARGCDNRLGAGAVRARQTANCPAVRLKRQVPATSAGTMRQKICRLLASNRQWCMKIASKMIMGSGIPNSQSNNPRPKPMVVSPQQL